eukprot:TRINITY_DN27431_c0_g1_i1.p1 TRINITY_DN27431_c0_g1~~TRINITY_DN27431_c0_g1_i1.p1  ORF type:complete len:176 (+),score=7.51 TRINITY_DN27431_c0_g1_i1:60-530(+)
MGTLFRKLFQRKTGTTPSLKKKTSFIVPKPREQLYMMTTVDKQNSQNKEATMTAQAATVQRAFECNKLIEQTSKTTSQSTAHLCFKPPTPPPPPPPKEGSFDGIPTQSESPRSRQSATSQLSFPYVAQPYNDDPWKVLDKKTGRELSSPIPTSSST